MVSKKYCAGPKCAATVASPIFCIRQNVWSLTQTFQSCYNSAWSPLNSQATPSELVKSRTDDFARFCRDNSKLDWQVLLQTVKNTSLRGWFWKKKARYMIASKQGSADLATGIQHCWDQLQHNRRATPEMALRSRIQPPCRWVNRQCHEWSVLMALEGQHAEPIGNSFLHHHLVPLRTHCIASSRHRAASAQPPLGLQNNRSYQIRPNKP